MSKKKKNKPKPTQGPGLSRRSKFAQIRAGVIALVNAADDIPQRMQAALKGGKSISPTMIDIIGSGFIVARDGFVATAAHVVKPWMAAASAFAAGGAKLPTPKFLVCSATKAPGNDVTWEMALGGVQHIYIHKSLDIAILQVRMPPNINPSPLPLDASGFEEGDEIGICGYPFGWHLNRDQLRGMAWTASFARGIVGAVLPFPHAPMAARQVFQVDITINGGNSGGPAFDMVTGNVIGVAIASVDAGRPLKKRLPAPTPGAERPKQDVPDHFVEVPSGIGRAIPIKHVQDLLAAIKQGKASTPSASPAAPEPGQSGHMSEHPPQS